MKKKVLSKIICSLALVGTVFAFVGCGSSNAKSNASASNDVWKYDTVFGSSDYNNRHMYFAKFDDSTGAVYVYSTDSADHTKLTAFAVFNVTYETTDKGVKCEAQTGYVHAMNGDNAIDSNMDSADQCTTWWNNVVGETTEFTLNDDGTVELALD